VYIFTFIGEYNLTIKELMHIGGVLGSVIGSKTV